MNNDDKLNWAAKRWQHRRAVHEEAAQIGVAWRTSSAATRMDDEDSVVLHKVAPGPSMFVWPCHPEVDAKATERSWPRIC